MLIEYGSNNFKRPLAALFASCLSFSSDFGWNASSLATSTLPPLQFVRQVKEDYYVLDG
jgi:hypothetical protein